MSSFINLISQATTAIASAALSGAAGQLATLANLVSADGTTATDRKALTRGLAHMGADLADIDRSLQQVSQGINTAVDVNNQWCYCWSWATISCPTTCMANGSCYRVKTTDQTATESLPISG